MPIDMSQAGKIPPRKTAVRQTKVAARTEIDTRAETARARVTGLQGLAQLAQATLLVVNQYADAATIGRYGPELSSELAKLADQYEVVAKPIDKLIQVGPFAGLIAVVVPMTMQIMANHKIISPGNMLGARIEPPEALETQMRMEVTKLQLEAARQQREAMEETRRLQAEMEKLEKEATGI